MEANYFTTRKSEIHEELANKAKSRFNKYVDLLEAVLYVVNSCNE
jgi:hypothetical protein